jgi:hypothetical protein
MNFRILSISFGVLVFLLFFNFPATAQSVERIGESLGKSNSSLITNILRDRLAQNRPPATVNLSVVTFKPVGDSGVAKALADALGANNQQKAALTEAFLQIKQGYEAEVVKEGKSNNLAAAFTFFIAANVMAYYESAEPSDKASESLFREMQSVIASIPEFARMSNQEKHQMHDWLVCMGGFVMAGYMDAKQTGDKQSLATYREFANYATRLILGIEVSKLSVSGDKFSIEKDNAVPQTANTNGNKIVGAWSKSASSPWGLDPGSMMTNAGYYKGLYQFKADGSYSFKGESWGGYSRSDEFWTIEESGSYSVNGESLTVSPRASTATLRNRAGVVKKSQNNQLEKVTYKWKLHYFEGIGETNLVLQTTQQTLRDGSFAGNSAFPNSYLYSQGNKLEWRF